MTYLLLVALLVFLVVGPKKFPDMMRQAAKLYAELSRAHAHFSRPFHEALRGEPTDTQKAEQAEPGQSQKSGAEQGTGELGVMPSASN